MIFVMIFVIRFWMDALGMRYRILESASKRGPLSPMHFDLGHFSYAFSDLSHFSYAFSDLSQWYGLYTPFFFHVGYERTSMSYIAYMHLHL